MANQYEMVTARIVAQLEAGVRPWAQGWVGGATRRPLRSAGVPYRGINRLWLAFAASERGFRSPYWVTFKGALALGGAVRKGAKSEPAFYAGSGVAMRDGAEGMAEEHRFRFLKSYRVFNADECDGLPEHMRGVEPPEVQTEAPIAICDAFVSHTGARIDHGGGSAFYMPSDDRIAMPEFRRFRTAADYYGTLFHELGHWTGAKHRLDRVLSPERQAYAAEELVGELCSAFLCGDLGADADPRESHAAYIASWLKWLRSDPRAIFAAASLAERAAAFLHALQPGAEAQATEAEEAA